MGEKIDIYNSFVGTVTKPLKPAFHRLCRICRGGHLQSGNPVIVGQSFSNMQKETGQWDDEV